MLFPETVALKKGEALLHKTKVVLMVLVVEVVVFYLWCDKSVIVLKNSMCSTSGGTCGAYILVFEWQFWYWWHLLWSGGAYDTCSTTGGTCGAGQEWCLWCV